MQRRILTELCVVFLSAGMLWPQTAVDLRTQSKSVDFSGAVSTTPWKTGATLPAVCSVGQGYFLVTAPVGQNLYSCTATNTWTPVVANGVAVSSVFGRSGAVTAQTGDYALTQLSDVTAKQGNTTTVQLYGGGTFAANDCAKFDTSGNVVSAGGACAGGGLQAGMGITVTTGSGPSTVTVDSAFVPGVVTSVTNLDFPSIDPQTCAEQDVALTGAALGSALAAGWPAAIEAGLVGNMRVSAASTVTIRLCNVTADAIDPAAADFRVTVFISL